MAASEITLNPGETFTVHLPGRGGAGYQWEYTVEGPDGIVGVSLTSSPELSGTMEAKPGGPPPSTYPVEIVAAIKGKAPGQVQVHLALHRSWEKNKMPLEERLLKITVEDKAG